MAVISNADILKRNNIENLVNRIDNKGSFNLLTENGDVLVATGKVKLVIFGNTYTEINSDLLRMFLTAKKSSDKFEVEVVHNKTKKFMSTTRFFKDKEFGGVAGKSTGTGSERQELGLINLLNENATKANKYYVSSLGIKNKILRAEKNEGLSPLKQEPYIDVFILTHDGKKYGISMKGDSAPSLAGGGLIGIKSSAPDLLDKIYTEIEKYIKGLGFKDGSVIDANLIPDIFIRIPDKYVKKILVGNKEMGGPVDYMYIGKMDVTGTVNHDTGEIRPNGTFYSIDEYMRKIPNFFFRIRKRDLQPDNMIQISFTKKNKEGYPLIFSAPKTGKNNFRMVIIDKVPSTGKKTNNNI
jgi:hypothetical protein